MRRVIAISALAALSACGGGGGNSLAPQGKVLIVRTPAQLRWADASTYCQQLTAQGNTGWRLPTINELAGYAKSGIEVGGGAVWSSDVGTGGHLYISLNSTSGSAFVGADTSYFNVRCAHD